MTSDFRDALYAGSLKDIRLVPKSDLHSHLLMGGERVFLERLIGRRIPPLKVRTQGIGDLNRWIETVYAPLFSLPGSFEKAVEAAFIQTVKDGVTVAGMSIDACFGSRFGIAPAEIVRVLKEVHARVAPQLAFLPEIGFARIVPVNELMKCFESFLELNYFCAIDLYDDEEAQSPEDFLPLFRLARQSGMQCKVHAGEFGNAASVRHIVEILEPDAIQHGIGAAESPEVMRWIEEREIPLHVSPASNIRLKRVRSYRSHPVRILYDHGIKVTISTDDRLVFGAGTSEQYLRLYRAGLFSAGELDEIRGNGLDSAYVNGDLKMNTAAGKAILALVREGDYAHAGETEAIETAFRDVRVESDSVILDLGCGRGGTADYIRQRFQPARITGIDLGEHSLAYAREHYPLVEFLRGDACHLSQYYNGQADLVCLFNSFYAFGDQQTALAEIWRSTRPGGRIMIFDYTDPGGTFHSSAGKRFPGWQPVSQTGLEQMMKVTGWNEIRWMDLSNGYLRWYEDLVSRIRDHQEQITRLFGSRWYRYVSGKYGDILALIRKGILGGALITGRK